MGKIWTINWSKYGKNMTMSILGQNMGKTWYIKWAKYGQYLDKIGYKVLCVGWCVVLFAVFVTCTGQIMV